MTRMRPAFARKRKFASRKLHDKHLCPSESFGNLLEDGRLSEAVEALNQQQCFIPNPIFLCLLQRCTTNKDLESGKRLHHLMIHRGLGSISFFCDHLIRFYGSCDNLEEANKVFCGASRHTVYTWNAIISVHIKLGKAERVLSLYKNMQQQGIQPTRVTYLYCLKACGSVQDIGYGRCIHSKIVIYFVHIDSIIGSALISMYSKCGTLEDAQRVFDRLQDRNSVLWGAMISGYVQIDEASLAFELFEKMLQQDMEPDGHTISSVLKACGTTGAFRQGMVIHNRIVKHQLEIDVVIQTSLVDMYLKCGALEEAHRVFGTSQNCNLRPWGALIYGYVERSEGLIALSLFHSVMQEKNLKPDKTIFSCTLKACGMVKCIDQGMLIHEQILFDDLQNDVIVGNALVDMYVKCGKLIDAYCIFNLLPQKDVVSWGAIISGSVQLGNGTIALTLVEKMLEQDIIPDEVLITSSLRACAIEHCRGLGLKMHDQLVRNFSTVGDDINNALVYMYISCALLEDAQRVFDRVSKRDVVLWTIMIDGYAQHDQSFLALALFMKMQHTSAKPDKFIYSCCLKACRAIGALGHGRWIHDQVMRNGLETDVVVGGALVDMYTFCENLGEAQTVFARLPTKNEVLWGAIIAGCAQSGNYAQVHEFLQRMQEQRLKPGNVVLTSVLSACSHAGLLEEGFSHFDSAQKLNGCVSGTHEYSCMVDLLGRAGSFNKASDLLETMPMPPSVFSWAALLSGCRTYSNSGCAQACFNEFVELNPMEASSYVMMSNIVVSDSSQEASCERYKEIPEAS